MCYPRSTEKENRPSLFAHNSVPSIVGYSINDRVVPLYCFVVFILSGFGSLLQSAELTAGVGQEVT